MAADPQAAPPRAPDQSATSAVHPKAPAPAAHPTHPLVQAIDQTSDIVGVIALTYYAGHHPAMAPELYVFALCAVLGVQTGLRRGLGARTGAGVGAAALLVLSLGQALSAGAHSQPGYVRVPRVVRRGLRWLLAVVACVSLTGCPLPPVDGCAPRATRCSPAGIPQRCSTTTRWWQEPTAQTCSTFGAVCCLAASPYGGAVHACVPQAACIPSPAGPTSSPAALAESQ